MKDNLNHIESIILDIAKRVAVTVFIGFIFYLVINFIVERFIIEKYPLVHTTKDTPLPILGQESTEEKGEEEVEAILKHPFAIDPITREAFYQTLNHSSQYLRRDSFGNE